MISSTRTSSSTAESAAVLAWEIHDAWLSDPDMPIVAGAMADAVRVFAIRAALAEQRGETAAALPAPAAVELGGMLLFAQMPELSRVAHRTGHLLILGRDEWAPGGELHRLYADAFGPTDPALWA
jgi:hypothetical protein